MDKFVVEAVVVDGTRTTLFSATTSVECRDFLDRYVRRLDDDGRAGGWSLIEVYDLRGEDPERITRWESPEWDPSKDDAEEYEASFGD